MVIHNTLVKFYGMRVAQDEKSEELQKDPTVRSGKEKINGLYYVRSSKDARRISVCGWLM